MISLRYGTIPIVFKTGGLADTIMPYDQTKGSGNGFHFTKYTKEDFLKAINQAVQLFKVKSVFQRLVAHAVEFHRSWDDVAHDYSDLYEQCLSINEKASLKKS
jgi:starch synthase